MSEGYASEPMSREAVQRGLPASLREPGPFRLLFWGQALSVVGDRIMPVAIAFAVLGLGSTTDLGLVMAAGGVPFLLFALAGGVWADRVGRRRVMLASDVARAASQALVATLLLTGSAEVWMLAALSFVYGVSAAVFMPALVGLIPQTVAGPKLQEANALLSLTRSVANVAGPALAGVIIATWGSGEAIAVDACTFVVSALCLARLRPRAAFMAAVALVGASTQAMIIGSGLGTAGIAALELLAGVCVALFFSLWDLSIQEQIPPRSVSRVSAYDFSVSVGLMPLGMAVCGPIADAIGLHATLRWMSAVGIVSALAWLAQPSVRALRRPEVAPK